MPCTNQPRQLTRRARSWPALTDDLARAGRCIRTARARSICAHCVRRCPARAGLSDGGAATGGLTACRLQAATRHQNLVIHHDCDFGTPSRLRLVGACFEVMDRNPSIVLPANESRCIPCRPCRLRGSCARYLAPLPASGATVADFSLGGDAGCDSCSAYLNAADYSIRRRRVAVCLRSYPALGDWPTRPLHRIRETTAL